LPHRRGQDMNDDADSKSRIGLGSIGGLSATTGLSILSPGVKDAILSRVNQIFDLKLYLEVPPWAGAVLLALGVVLLILAFIGQGRLDRASVWIRDGRGASVGTFLAVKHDGFFPLVRKISQDELPSDMRRRDLRHLDIDLSHDLSIDPPALEAALVKQLRMPDQINAILGVTPDADLGYCGIIQAPFQLLAGYQLASWLRLRCFEWHRHDQRWIALTSGTGSDLCVAKTAEQLGVGADIAIAVEVSYAIDSNDIMASVPAVGQLVRVRVAVPELDCITHEGQVVEIARQFRTALDGARGLPAGAHVHVFCSAPMSVGFALGRMISRTLHPPVRAYAYDRKANKPYPWGLEVNGTPSAGRVVRN